MISELQKLIVLPVAFGFVPVCSARSGGPYLARCTGGDRGRFTLNHLWYSVWETGARKRDATDHTLKDTMVFGQRAHVGINVLAALRMDTQKASFTFENFGQTPAKDVKVFSNWEFVEAGGNLPKDFAFPEKTGCNDTSLVPPELRYSLEIQFQDSPTTARGDYQKLLLVEKTNCAGSITDISHIATCSTNRRTCVVHAPGGSAVCDRQNEMDPDENH